MVGQVIRAVEVPVSLSLAVARKGAMLAGRVTGWAVTGIVREVLPGRSGNGAVGPETADQGPPAHAPAGVTPAPAATDEVEPAAGAPEWSSARAATEAEPTRVAEQEEPTATAPEWPDPTAADVPLPTAAEEPPATTPGEPSPTTAHGPSPSAPDGSPPPASGDAETGSIDGEQPDAAPIGGEEEVVVEHEPGLGTSVRARSPHSALNNPVTEPDLTEWPDPYDKREDPRDPGEEMAFGSNAGHTQTGAISTSEPHPAQDPEATQWEGPKRDKVDE